MPGPSTPQGNERTWWWKVAKHLDEAQLAAVNALAHNVDDPSRIILLQETLRQGQAILLQIFHAKGLLPAARPASAPLPPVGLPPGATPSPPAGPAASAPSAAPDATTPPFTFAFPSAPPPPWLHDQQLPPWMQDQQMQDQQDQRPPPAPPPWIPSETLAQSEQQPQVEPLTRVEWEEDYRARHEHEQPSQPEAAMTAGSEAALPDPAIVPEALAPVVPEAEA